MIAQILAAARALPEGFGLVRGPMRSVKLHGRLGLREGVLACYYGAFVDWGEAWVIMIDRPNAQEARRILAVLDALKKEIDA